MKSLAIISSLFLTPTLWAEASLTFTDSGASLVEISTPTSMANNSDFTVALWVYPTTTSDLVRTYSKGDISLTRSNSAVGQQRPSRNRTAAVAYASPNGYMQTNRWIFFAVTFSSTAAASQLYTIYKGTGPLSGSAATNLLQITPVSTSDGSGPYSDDSGSSFCIGGALALTNRGFGGQIATAAYWSRVLSLSELQNFQWTPKPEGAGAFLNLGFNGTGTQYDLSGTGNNGKTRSVSASTNGPPVAIGGHPL